MKTQSDINDAEIDLNSKLQRFVYRCISMFGPDGSNKHVVSHRKRELMDVWLHGLFNGEDYRLVFDETLWLPDNTELYGNIAELYVRVKGISKLVRVDFRNTWHPIFDVEYIGNECVHHNVVK